MKKRTEEDKRELKRIENECGAREREIQADRHRETERQKKKEAIEKVSLIGNLTYLKHWIVSTEQVI